MDNLKFRVFFKDETTVQKVRQNDSLLTNHLKGARIEPGKARDRSQKIWEFIAAIA